MLWEREHLCSEPLGFMRLNSAQSVQILIPEWRNRIQGTENYERKRQTEAGWG